MLGKPLRVIIPVHLLSSCSQVHGEPTCGPSRVCHGKLTFMSFHVLHNSFLPHPFPFSFFLTYTHKHICTRVNTRSSQKRSQDLLCTFAVFGCQWESVSGISTLAVHPQTAYKFSKSATIRSVAEILADLISGGQPRELGICCEAARLFPLSSSDSAHTSDRAAPAPRACDTPAGINRTAWALSPHPRVMTFEQNQIKALTFFPSCGIKMLQAKAAENVEIIIRLNCTP